MLTKWRFYFFLLFIFSATACRRVESPSQLLKPLPQDPFVQVYFNHAESSQYQEPYRQQTRLGNNLEHEIITTISQAQSTIDLAVQELRLPKVAQALVNKQKAGVKVRVILENTYSSPWSSLTPEQVNQLSQREQERYLGLQEFLDINKNGELSSEEVHQRDALVILDRAKIPRLDDTADNSAGSGLMHHKFVIVDNRILLITSANFTLSEIYGDFNNLNSLGNTNNFLKIDSPELAMFFTEEFNIMWGDGPGGKPDSQFGLKKPLRLPKQVFLGDNQITLQFSPVSKSQLWSMSSNGLIGKNLEASQKSVDLALFVFSEQKLANILENRHQKNVKIRALIDPLFAYRYYSEALDMMGFALMNKCKYQPDNRPWQNPLTSVGVPLLPKGDLLHHKFGLIDEKIVITGSHNWSAAANHNNDETLLIINNPVVAAHYKREFDRLYNQARLGLPLRIRNKIREQEKQCL